MEVNWTNLWDDSGEDDEDYDPKKDPLLLGHTDDDDGDDSDLEGCRHLLSPGDWRVPPAYPVRHRVFCLRPSLFLRPAGR